MTGIYQALLTAAAAGASPGDANFANVKLLCHFDGTNGSTTYTNSATGGGTIVQAGTSALTTTSPLFGTASMDTTGTANSRALAADSVDYQLGTGDFTLEFAFYTATPAQANKTLIDFNQTLTHATTGFEIYINSSSFRFYFNSADRITGGTVLTNTWQRIALSRVSGTTRLYIDGTKVGSNYTDGNTYNHGTINLGAESGGGAGAAGHYDEWRLTVGVGRYSGASYTVDAAAFPDHA